MTPLHEIDLVLRGGGIALSLLLAALFAREAPGGPAGRMGFLFSIALGAYLICSSPAFDAAEGAWRWLVLPWCFTIGGFLWLFARALFDDAYRTGILECAVLVLLVVLGTAAVSAPGTVGRMAGTGISLAGFALAAHAVYIAWQGRSDDLVEARRLLRPAFVILAALYAVVVASVEIVIRFVGMAPWLTTLNAFGILVLLVVTMFFLLAPRRSILGQERPPGTRQPEAEGDLPLPEEERDLDALHRLLLEAMEVDRAFRDEALSIGKLAERLGVQEYRLRRLINGHLGYRNFSAFLNSYRIAEAKAALEDPSQDDVPILTIAFDAGFASIGPFNRAFKATTGLTPSEYRRQRGR